RRRTPAPASRPCTMPRRAPAKGDGAAAGRRDRGSLRVPSGPARSPPDPGPSAPCHGPACPHRSVSWLQPRPVRARPVAPETGWTHIKPAWLGGQAYARRMTREWPDLTVLELLVRIDELGSLGAAARRIDMAQPNATRRIRSLEKQLGLPLLDRNPRGSRLTAQGTVIAHWARELLSDADRLLDAAVSLRGERESEMDIGASMTVAEHLVPSWLGAFREEHPDVRVPLRVQNSTEVSEAVLTGEHDVGFVESP